MPNNVKKETVENIQLLTIGDSSIDLFMRVPDNAQNIQADETNISFAHGSKIMVEGFSSSISGNSVNIACGTNLLGIKTAIYTETGDDDNATKLEHQLHEQGINTKLVIKNKNTETSLHSVIVYKGERTIFSYHGERHYSVKDWGTPNFIYYTSLGKGFESFQTKLVEYVKKSKVGLAFNPGTFQMAQGVKALTNVLAVTDILIVNKEEAQKLTLQTTNDLTLLHKDLHDLGVKLSVITDGKNGVTAYDGSNMHTQTAFAIDKPLVDMTGAGDAFSAGFMSAILYGKTLQEALKWGTINSSAQIRVVGSVDGMLTKDALEKLL